MKENITVKPITKGLEDYDLQIAKDWLNDLVGFIVRRNFEKRDVSEELDKCIGGDLLWFMSIDEWLRFRGYLSLKEAYNLNKKRFERLGNLENINTAKPAVCLKTEVDFLGRHHLRFTLSLASKNMTETVMEFSVNLHAVNHLANLSLLQLLRAFDIGVQVQV